MTLDESGRLSRSVGPPLSLSKEMRGDRYCSHARLVERTINKKRGWMKRSLICRECGRIFLENQKETSKKA